VDKDIIIGGYPIRDKDGKFIGHHTVFGEDIYFEENDNAVQEQEADALDVREQAEDGEAVGR